MSALTIAMLAGLGGMLGWGCADLFAKKTIDKIGDVMTLAWAGVFGCVAFAGACTYAVLVSGQTLYIPTTLTTWSALAFLGSLQAVVYIFAYRAFAEGQVGILSPIFASFAAIVAFISIVFLRESTTILRVMFLVVTFIGIITINADFSLWRSMRVSFAKIEGFGNILMATILSAIWTLLWDRFLTDGQWLFDAFYMFVFMTVAVCIFGALRGLSFKVRSPMLWAFLFAVGLCEVVAYVAISLGYASTPYASIVAMVSGAFSLPTIFLAWIFLHEKYSRTHIAGMIITITGIVLLAIV